MTRKVTKILCKFDDTIYCSIDNRAENEMIMREVSNISFHFPLSAILFEEKTMVSIYGTLADISYDC